MQTQKIRLLIIIVISLLSSAVVYLSVECFLLAKEVKSAEVGLKVQQTDEKAAFFVKLFIDKVLLSTGIINFEDRLKLENAVRDLNDPDIFIQWQKFTASKNDAETQKIVGNILKMLVDKISS